jgi:hypothetical protein
MYKNEVISDNANPPENSYGFVYELLFTDNTRYIGMKNFFTYKEKDLLKSGNKRPNHVNFINRNKKGKRIKEGKRIKKEIIKVETNWRSYRSSSKLVKEKEIANKTILEIAYSKRHLTYLEAKWLFKEQVLEKNEYLNENILGKFFKNNLGDSYEAK